MSAPELPTVTVIVYAPQHAPAEALLRAVQSAEASDLPKDRFDVTVMLDQYGVGEDVCDRVAVERATTEYVAFMGHNEEWTTYELRHRMELGARLGHHVENLYTRNGWLEAAEEGEL